VTDLLARTAELVDIPSVSHDEAAIVDHLAALLAEVPWLEVERVGDNLVARTDVGRDRRLVLAGHTDTVPASDTTATRIDGDTLWGLGAADMKGGLAVMVELARTVDAPVVDVSYVFYASEEVASHHSGLLELFERRPDLVTGDAALLGEPTAGALEAGCQGSMRLRVSLVGERAHTARPWMGRNAIHRLGRVLRRLDTYSPRRPVIDGCEYREGLQAVHVEGGVAGNVVPDQSVVILNHRFAPDRSAAEAEQHVRELLAPELGDGDEIDVVEVAGAAPPALDHPLIASLVAAGSYEVRAKLGWTDVARFAEHGIPAANFGPGDPHLAHTAGERLERVDLESVHAGLRDLLLTG
jgi:succinyl-diaminopimelate desuccinylase